jgi:hypothetical protein
MTRFILSVLVSLALTCSQVLASGFLLNSFSVAPAFPTYEYKGCSSPGAASTTYTLTATNVGTAASDRLTVIGITTSDAATVYNVSTVTVGGDSASNTVSSSRASSVGGADFYQLSNPAGTSEDVVVTMSEATNGLTICVWALYGLASSTAVATNSGASASAASMSLNINVSANGIALGMCGGQTNGSPFSWTGLTLLDEANGGGVAGSYSSAMLNPSSASTPLTVACDPNGSTVDQGAVAASWR